MSAMMVWLSAGCELGDLETLVAQEGLEGTLARLLESGVYLTFDEFKDRQIGAVPIKRIIDPAEVAGLVTFLCSPEAAAITGQTYNICGGQTMA